MTDAELRGRLLTIFHERRHNAQGWVPTSDINLSGAEVVTRQAIGGVCQQLADAGLIRWKPLTGANEGFVIGMAQITGLGVDVVDGLKSPTISVRLPLKPALDLPSERRAIELVPTLYPERPDGTITVQNHIAVDTQSYEFRDFIAKINALIDQLRQSNEIAGETRDKVVAEIKAGVEILGSPKPDPKMIDLLLKRPLIFVADKSAGVVVGAVATAALALLGKLSGLW